jgi:hypothetical protein
MERTTSAEIAEILAYYRMKEHDRQLEQDRANGIVRLGGT